MFHTNSMFLINHPFKSSDGSEGVFVWDSSNNIAGHVQSLGETFYLVSCGQQCYVWITMDGQWDEEEEIELPFTPSQTRPKVFNCIL